MARIYLDNAATSWPKPEAVYRAVDTYQREVGAPAGRSAYREAEQVQRLVDRARRCVGQLIGVDQPERIVFTLNATDALNIAIGGLLRSGDHVITSEIEHNSVLRPLRYWQQECGVRVTRVAANEEGFIDPDSVRTAMTSDTRLVALSHVSNVTGAIQPLESIGEMVREHEALLLVDGAQSLGHRPVDVGQLNADLFAASGHKGLLGPLGTGILYIAPGVESELKPMRRGGTGSVSESDHHPESLPDKYEAGNWNVPGIVGLEAGVNFVLERSTEKIREDEERLTGRLLDGLKAIRGVNTFGPTARECQTGVVSLTIDGYQPQEVAATLDASYSIQVRAGLHCAPLIHGCLGTAGQGGTVRISLGTFTNQQDIDAVVVAIAEIATAALSV